MILDWLVKDEITTGYETFNEFLATEGRTYDEVHYFQDDLMSEVMENFSHAPEAAGINLVTDLIDRVRASGKEQDLNSYFIISSNSVKHPRPPAFLDLPNIATKRYDLLQFQKDLLAGFRTRQWACYTTMMICRSIMRNLPTAPSMCAACKIVILREPFGVSCLTCKGMILCSECVKEHGHNPSAPAPSTKEIEAIITKDKIFFEHYNQCMSCSQCREITEGYNKADAKTQKVFLVKHAFWCNKEAKGVMTCSPISGVLFS